MDISFDGWGLAPSRQFLRNWTGGDSEEAGAWGRDEIRNIYGRFAFQTAAHGAAYLAPVADAGQIVGAFKIFGPPHSAAYPSQAITSAGPGIGIEMNAFNNVPTGQQNVPQHIWQPVIIYLGRPR
ncbi:hypothetical protein [uncultured Desulfovibrio sp.]|uniref:hypothetical protein n=1 Tax=uncultured Desulfovibrio sp. TaxID=167968 RepID=UPI00260AC644|nr:hypothetical protein [uncultured Desulfovibrio sp.]